MTEGWGDFFVAVTGAAAALAGLIIVAMSVTIKEILASRALPSRAATTISSLVLIRVIAVLSLIPHQTDVALGIEITVAALVGLAPPIMMVQRMATDDSYRRSTISRVFIGLLGIAPVALAVLAGLFLIAGSVAALPLVAASCVTVFAASMLNAWVLLVEVQR
jgi:modulator of FtsH protease